jgi:hypothetical protein
MPQQQNDVDELAGIERKLSALREKHCTALTAGNLGHLNQVQVELAELMERREQLQLLGAA